MNKYVIFCIVLLSSLSLSAEGTFTLTSKDLGGQATMKEVFNGFGCTGQNVSPSLYWKNAPKGTKSFAITMYDKDAPTGSGWWHWLAFNIPAKYTSIPSGASGAATGKSGMPKGTIESMTDYGKPGYGGPCPPQGHGDHQYLITVHALSVDRLPSTEATNPAVVGFQIGANTIEKASIVMYYGRD